MEGVLTVMIVKMTVIKYLAGCVTSQFLKMELGVLRDRYPTLDAFEAVVIRLSPVSQNAFMLKHAELLWEYTKPKPVKERKPVAVTFKVASVSVQQELFCAGCAGKLAFTSENGFVCTVCGIIEGGGADWNMEEGCMSDDEFGLEADMDWGEEPLAQNNDGASGQCGQCGGYQVYERKSADMICSNCGVTQMADCNEQEGFRHDCTTFDTMTIRHRTVYDRRNYFQLLVVEVMGVDFAGEMSRYVMSSYDRYWHSFWELKRLRPCMKRKSFLNRAYVLWQILRSRGGFWKWRARLLKRMPRMKGATMDGLNMYWKLICEHIGEKVMYL